MDKVYLVSVLDVTQARQAQPQNGQAKPQHVKQCTSTTHHRTAWPSQSMAQHTNTSHVMPSNSTAKPGHSKAQYANTSHGPTRYYKHTLSHCTPSHGIVAQERHSTPLNGMARQAQPQNGTPWNGTARHATSKTNTTEPTAFEPTIFKLSTANSNSFRANLL